MLSPRGMVLYGMIMRVSSSEWSWVLRTGVNWFPSTRIRSMCFSFRMFVAHVCIPFRVACRMLVSSISVFGHTWIYEWTHVLRMNSESVSLFFLESFFESLISFMRGCDLYFGSRITDATTRGPSRLPLPASSIPRMVFASSQNSVMCSCELS